MYVRSQTNNWFVFHKAPPFFRTYMSGNVGVGYEIGDSEHDVRSVAT